MERRNFLSVTDTPAPRPAAQAPAARPPLERQRYGFEFTGSAGEYFRVWIVNIALTAVTLGIYSAWAKVRNKQYFYGNTRLAGGSFEYTANPVNILKGRLLVLGAFIAYQAAAIFQPLLGAALALVLVPLIPWVVNRAISFNLRYSSYRGLRFHFDGRYWEAFRVYLLWTLAIGVTFGLAYPYVVWRRKQFFVDNARYGRSPFHFEGEVGWFYVVYIVGSLAYSGIMLVAVLLVVGGGVGLAALSGGIDPGQVDLGEWGKVLAAAALVAAYGGFLLSVLVFNAAVQAMIANHVWQRTRTADVTFDMRLDLFRIIWLQASNIAAIIASLGLAIPWARVRMVRYKLSCFSLLAVPADLERFVAAEREALSATGEELGEVLDLDLGL